jgi:hypothetical protein
MCTTHTPSPWLKGKVSGCHVSLRGHCLQTISDPSRRSPCTFFAGEVPARKGAIMDHPQEDAHMDSMDNIGERFAALEQRTEQLQQQTRTVERRLRWWRGLACGAIVLGLLSGALPSGKTVDAQQGGW